MERIFLRCGANLKNCSGRLQRIKPCGSFDPKANKLLAGLDSFLLHNSYGKGKEMKRGREEKGMEKEKKIIPFDVFGYREERKEEL